MHGLIQNLTCTVDGAHACTVFYSSSRLLISLSYFYDYGIVVYRVRNTVHPMIVLYQRNYRIATLASCAR